MIRFVFILGLVFFFTDLTAQPTQTIAGSVIDNASNTSISYATIVVQNSIFSKTIKTDSVGNFVLQKVPVGRYNIQATSSGYEPYVTRDIIVISAKETYITISMKQKITELNEVVVRPRVNKDHALNSMATVSARMLSVEEAKRYAGGFDDPARLASAFAGVAGNTEVNGIIIRGNAPKFVQWKMEGIEIPNPNHFGDLKTFGGGALTALSSQMLANSDFFTGAFPAEYNNALSGVFDISMRKGSNVKRESAVQIGVSGIDVSSEGPFKRGAKSSYLFNYRYSTLALLQGQLPDDANKLKYQDLSFKLNFPTLKSGTFSIWGIGLIDKAGSKAKTDSLKWQYKNDLEENDIKQSMLASGINHVYFFKHSAYIKTSLAATINRTDWSTQKFDNQLTLKPFSKIGNTNWNFVFSSFLNKKFSVAHTNRTGITLTGLKYDLFLNHATTPGNSPKELVNANGFSTLISAFSSSAISISDATKLNVGINGQYFTLNKKYTIEPRLGISQQLGEKHSLALAYGLHSRLEQLNFYFNNSFLTGQVAVNKNLDFTKAHHLVIGYDWKASELLHLKIEPYYQQLFNVPVIADSSFSLLNLQEDWFFSEKLKNIGKGRNYGIDFTLEKYLSKGYYYLLSASVFKSKYRGGDSVWHGTRYDRGYVLNALYGKEWQVGKQNQNTLGLNARVAYQGGNRYSPVNTVLSSIAKNIIYDEKNAFAMQSTPTLNIHFTASYKMNRQKTSHEIALKVLNATRQPDFYGYKYNLRNNSIDKDFSSVIIPNLSYKIEF